MQTITRAVQSRRERGASSHRSGQSTAAPTSGDASSVGVETLAGRFGLALPTLANVPISYNHEVHSELLYDLCAALVRCGTGRASHWKPSGENGNLFVQKAVREAITDERRELLSRNIEYHLQISGVTDQYGNDTALEANELTLGERYTLRRDDPEVEEPRSPSLQIETAFLALTQALGNYAHNCREFTEVRRLK